MLEDVESRLSVQSHVGAQHPVTFQSSNSLSRNENRTWQLDKLPLEIIQRIASHGLCKAVLALRCVCRVLHHACSDVFIMRNILEQGSIQPSDSATSSRPAWYDSVLSLRAPLSSWARYALAHGDIEQLIKNLEEESRGDADRLPLRRITSWLPQLLALHYPLQADHQATLHSYLFSELQGQVIHPKEEQVIIFCLIASNKPSRWVTTPSVAMGGQVWISRFRLSRAWHNFAEGITIAKAQWIVFGFQSILQYISHRTVAVSYQKVYPNGDQVPFSSFMKIPLPFLESSAIDFVSCHHLAMTTPAFLIGDEWVGYYSDSSSITRLDPPMRSIIFERDHSESASIPEMLPLSTRGIDSVGAFTLVGKVDCGSGRFGFVKQYINSHSWQWSGVMTPFGMVGKWYGEGTTYGTGWFWLWKAEWTHESS